MTPSAFSRLFRRPAGTASVEYGFFAAVTVVGILTILGSIGGPMRVEIEADSAPLPVARISAADAAAPEEGAALRIAAADTTPSSPVTATASAPPALAVTDPAMVLIEQALATLEAQERAGTAGVTGPDAISRDEAFERLIQTLLIEETEAAGTAAAQAVAPDAAKTRSAAVVDWTPAPETTASPAADWIPATGFLPEPDLQPMPRPARLASN